MKLSLLFVSRGTHEQAVAEMKKRGAGEVYSELIAELQSAHAEMAANYRAGGSRLAVRERMRLEGAVMGLNRAAEHCKRLLSVALQKIAA